MSLHSRPREGIRFPGMDYGLDGSSADLSPCLSETMTRGRTGRQRVQPAIGISE